MSRSPRILIVDDQRAIRWSLRRSLLAEGFDVEEASTAREAVLAVTQGGAFDAIVLDSRLPDTRAVDLLDEIKNFAPLTPVIVMATMPAHTRAAATSGHSAQRLIDPGCKKPYHRHARSGVRRWAPRRTRR